MMRPLPPSHPLSINIYINQDAAATKPYGAAWRNHTNEKIPGIRKRNRI